jgi:hypothetical protein
MKTLLLVVVVAVTVTEVVMPTADVLEAVVFLVRFVFLDVDRDFLLDVHRHLDRVGLRDRDLHRIRLGNMNGVWYRNWHFDLDLHWVWHLLLDRIRHLLLHIHWVGLVDVHRDRLLHLDLIRDLDRVWNLLLYLHRVRMRDRDLDFLMDRDGLDVSFRMVI